MQRQWIGLSLTGDQATVERLPDPPHQGAPGFVQAMDIEVGFLKRGVDIAEVYSADDMAKKFAKAFVGTAMTTEQTVVFEYHGQNLKGLIKSVVLLEVPGRPPSSMKNTGIISETTDVAIMKSAESTIKIKSSAKRSV
jgi:vesicle-fusing ATPase